MMENLTNDFLVINKQNLDHKEKYTKIVVNRNI